MTRILILTLSILFPASAKAHFIWLAPIGTGSHSKVCVHFGEDATDDSADYLSRVSGVTVYRVAGSDPATALEMTRTDESISTTVNSSERGVYVASSDLGVLDRGDSTFRLKYYAKTGPVASSPDWQNAIASDDLRLDIVPTLKGDSIELKLCFDQQPVAAAQIKVIRPGADDVETETNKHGIANFSVADSGLYSIRARHIEVKPGELDGKAYPETRHYSTVSLIVPETGSSSESTALQDLPVPVTSFGAAVLNNSLYLYGGHTGSAHSYSRVEQGKQLMELNLKSGAWKSLAEGPGLQGLALVTDGTKLYRVGGFSAMNAEGEDHDLWSQNDVACFDPELGEWTELPALPERRSSHDAAVVGNSIYVVGGWAMKGDSDSHWHTTAWKMDLTQSPLHWQPIAEPPFKRRALAAAAHQGRLYVVGGMQQEGGPTTKTAVYDPANDTWSKGPSLVVNPDPKPADGEKPRRSMSSGAMTGFGASAFATGGSLYVTTVQGTLQRLAVDGSKWEVLPQDVSPRFFHRLLPMNDRQLVVVGGSNMSIGKFEEVEVIEIGDGT